MKVFHADHGVTEETLNWALAQVTAQGFFLVTLTLPEGHPDILNGLYGPACGDAPVHSTAEVTWVRRSADRPLSRMVARPKRPTRLLTVIGTRVDGDVTIFTAYGGPAAEREPGDPSIDTDTDEGNAARYAAEMFWQTHALASM